MKKYIFVLISLLIFSCGKKNEDIIEVKNITPSFEFISTPSFQVFPLDCGNFILPSFETIVRDIDINEDGILDFRLLVKILYRNELSIYNQTFIRKHTEISVEALQENSFTTITKNRNNEVSFFNYNDIIDYDAVWQEKSYIYLNDNEFNYGQTIYNQNRSFELIDGVKYMGLLMESTSSSPKFGWISFETKDCHFEFLEIAFKTKGDKNIIAGQTD